MTSTFRYDAVTALKTALDAYVAANPSTLKAAYKTRPASFGNLPCVYIGKRYEVITEDRSTLRRRLRTSVVLVDAVTDNTETMGRLDPLVDGLIDHLMAAFRSIPNAGPLSLLSTDGDELAPDTGAPYELEVIGLEAETEYGTGL